MEDKPAALLRARSGSSGDNTVTPRGERAPPVAVRRREAQHGLPRQGTQIDRPIFVIGVGRCGSTIFHRMFSEHPQVAWLSNLCNRYPSRLALNRAFQRMNDWPLMHRALRRHYKPGECYVFWNHYCRGFGEPCRDLRSFDVSELNKRRVPAAMAKLMTSRRQRLLYKITGWPRIGFLRALFPDARFIHVYRDGRAVANSLLAVNFWDGWHGPDEWRWGALPAEQQAEWERHGKSFIALAGIQWKLLMDATALAAARLPSQQFMQIRYEDFVTDPVRHFRAVTKFCELDWSRRFEKSLAHYELASTNDKWRTDLTAEQQAVLQAVLGESLAKYGYS